MDPYVAERMATVRCSELAALAEASHAARRHHRARRAQAVAAEEAVRAWRLTLGRRLVSAGLRLALPPERRPLARRDATALLGEEDLTAC